MYLCCRGLDHIIYKSSLSGIYGKSRERFHAASQCVRESIRQYHQATRTETTLLFSFLEIHVNMGTSYEIVCIS
jgi:hypothetical protein